VGLNQPSRQKIKHRLTFHPEKFDDRDEGAPLASLLLFEERPPIEAAWQVSEFLIA
jgi:hypothetical protein